MKKISIMILLLVAVLASCKKTPEVNLKYVDVERDLITVGATTATIQCDYEYIATLKKAFLYYCEGTDTINMSIAEMSVVQKTLYVELSGLKENTTYSYYYEFANGFNSMRSATKTFKTEASPVTPPEITLPTVVTAEVTEITSNSAQCGGEVTNDGGAEVAERGICWSTNANPTLNDSHIASGTGIGAFTAIMSSLEVNTTYHVRAYAVNEAGTAYGLDREFTTPSGGGSGDAPIGAINGLFTINDRGDQVYFSQGNLLYQASTNTWKFAENQWNFVGNDTLGNVHINGIKCNNEQISPSYDGWIDLFGWGTSGYPHGAVCYQPYSSSIEETDYFPYGLTNSNLYDNSGLADWGNNTICNGNNGNHWRTLKLAEWDYILDRRETLSQIRFASARVNDVDGVLLLPDDWSESIYGLNNTNDSWYLDFNSNIIDENDWKVIEQYGAVFIPAAGVRRRLIVENLVISYWTSTRYYSDVAFDLIYYDGIHFGTGGRPISYGLSVRLVQDANK